MGSVARVTEISAQSEKIDYAKPASDEAIMRSQSALEAHGITALVVDTPELALAKALALIPNGASAAWGSSVTLETLGFKGKLAASGHYDRLRALARLMEHDHVALSHDVRDLLARSDLAVGSANAVTEDGSLIFGSMSGSQLGPYVSGAGTVILIVGAQKIVTDVDAGLRRLREYVLPLERERVRKASSSGDTRLNSILIINGSIVRGRITVILVRQAIGY